MAVLEYSLVYLTGAFGYGGLELCWRGYTHWSMMPTGGLCFLMLYLIGNHSHEKFWKKCVMGSCLITTVEFLVGAVVNLKMGWGVWDYSKIPLNIMGQICLPFSLCWFVLSAPGLWLCKKMRRGLSMLHRGKA